MSKVKKARALIISYCAFIVPVMLHLIEMLVIQSNDWLLPEGFQAHGTTDHTTYYGRV
jgi:hypothetical protein